MASPSSLNRHGSGPPASGRARKRFCAIRVGASRHSMLTCMLLLLQLSGAVGQLCTILLIEATATAATDADAERAASAANGLSERGRRAFIFHGHHPHSPHGHHPHSPHSHHPHSPIVGCSNTCNYASDGECDDGGPGAQWAFCSLGTDCVDCGPRSSSHSHNPHTHTPHSHSPHSHSPHSHHPPPSPSTQTSSLTRWTVLSGGSHCEITSDGRCITDGIGNYGNYEYCTFRAEVSMTVTTTVFGTESCCDFITIGGTRYSGSTGPMNVQVAAGSTVTWNSDGSVTGTGFQICTDTPLSPDGCACITSSMGCASAIGIDVNPRCGCFNVDNGQGWSCYVYGGRVGCPSATISNWIDGLAYIPCTPTVETGMPIIGIIACVAIALVLAMVFLRWYKQRWPQVTVVDTTGIQMYESPCACADDGC